MKKRIFRDMSIIILLSILLLTLLSGLLFQSRFSSEIKDGLKTLRVTIISDTGEVLFDNYRTGLENHANRPEVIEAQAKGFGESQRYSDTLGNTTYYYAIKMNDNKILRLSITIDSIYSWLYGLIPFVILSLIIVMIISLLLAKRLTNKLVTPINTLDLDNIIVLPYDELAPFAKKIQTQKSEIMNQVSALESRANTIKTITDNMKEGLILVDKKGIILSSNKSINNIFGQNDILNKNILHLNRNIEFLDKAKQALLGNRSEMILGHKSKAYMVYFSPVTLEKFINGAIILFLDITDKSVAEKQRKEFSANVSHELKTPLTIISALSEMIGNGMAKPEDIKGFAEKINTQSSRLLNLIDDIIRLSAFDEDSIEKEFEVFNVTELVKTVVDSLFPFANSKCVTVSVDAENIQVNANKRMIDELILNLVDNAIKYNKEGGNVNISITKEMDFIKLKVGDTGIGISEEHQKRIFERFYRVDKSRSKHTGGTGLGLSIIKHIVEFHGGKVDITSDVDVGTTIICFLRILF